MPFGHAFFRLQRKEYRIPSARPYAEFNLLAVSLPRSSGNTGAFAGSLSHAFCGKSHIRFLRGIPGGLRRLA